MSTTDKQASMTRHPSGAADNRNGTSVTVTRDSESHETTGIDGDIVTYSANSETDTHTAGQWPAEADQHVRGLITDAEHKRQQLEDVRANHRNHNRLYTLLFTLFAGLLITFALSHGWVGAWGLALAPYSFVITVAGDTVLTAYALIKRY